MFYKIEVEEQGKKRKSVWIYSAAPSPVAVPDWESLFDQRSSCGDFSLAPGSVCKQEHYQSRNIRATYGLHMGHILGPGLQHTYIWAFFLTYGVLLKHTGPF